MIADLKPYPAMKDSGMEWLGAVPKHWAVGAVRRKLRTYDGIKIGPFGSQLKLEQMSSSGYKVYGQANVIARDFARGTKFVNQEKFNALSACEVLPGDLLVTMMGTIGRCAFVPDDASMGIMDSHLLRLRTDFSINVRFVSRIIDEARYVKEQISVAGKGSIMHGLNSGIVKALVLALPPLAEQAAIVRFLDYADRRIRRFIRAKQMLITLLEEQKQAIIHRAVTRGLDPNVRLKPSGVEWLGDVPEHWKILQLGRLIKLLTGFPFKSDGFTQDADDIRLLRGVNIVPGKVRWNDIVRWRISDRLSYLSFELHAGDIVLGMDRPIIQSGVRVATIEESDLPSLLLQRVARIRPQGMLRADFLILLLAGKSFSDYLTPIFTGISVPHLSPEQIRLFRFALPGLMEQEKIVEWTVANMKTVESAVERTHREISLLREYRTRLIADVVTGKLDVRQAAAQVPDEVEEPEPLDEAEAIVNNGEEEPAEVEG